jgi:hypothetical protein
VAVDAIGHDDLSGRDECEQEDPDNVTEMPIESGAMTGVS